MLLIGPPEVYACQLTLGWEFLGVARRPIVVVVVCRVAVVAVAAVVSLSCCL
jgi:hypothetical protein